MLYSQNTQTVQVNCLFQRPYHVFRVENVSRTSEVEGKNSIESKKESWWCGITDTSSSFNFWNASPCICARPYVYLHCQFYGHGTNCCHLKENVQPIVSSVVQQVIKQMTTVQVHDAVITAKKLMKFLHGSITSTVVLAFRKYSRGKASCLCAIHTAR